MLLSRVNLYDQTPVLLRDQELLEYHEIRNSFFSLSESRSESTSPMEKTAPTTADLSKSPNGWKWREANFPPQPLSDGPLAWRLKMGPFFIIAAYSSHRIDLIDQVRQRDVKSRYDIYPYPGSPRLLKMVHQFL